MSYADPNLTQRQIIEDSKATIDAIITGADEKLAAAKAALDQPIDYITAQAINQHINAVNINRAVMVTEQVRLAAILASWDATANV